jgi:hypothetical protein
VDVKQDYTIAGTLSGSLAIDYRIHVDGPCGSPIGTFDETWIAHGTFTGTVHEKEESSAFRYTARVKAGGQVIGSVVFGPGVEGELEVSGNFGDAELSYQGWVD